MLKLLPIFVTIFLAELGDKTQLATLLFASGKEYNALGVFAAATLALVLSTAIAVLLGAAAGKYLAVLPLKLFAGLGFITIGAWTLWDYARGS
jgi:putative Ca2+/H+ antiporter (TMEM165/GDT1 family)